MLMATLAPGISRALAAATPGTAPAWAEICSIATDNGYRISALSSDAASRDAGPGHGTLHFDHCAYCHLAGDAPAVPVPTLIDSTATTIVVRHPQLFLQAPHTLHAWRAAQPRGPPSLLS